MARLQLLCLAAMAVLVPAVPVTVADGKTCCEPQQYKCCKTNSDCCTDWGKLECSVGVCVFPGSNNSGDTTDAVSPARGLRVPGGYRVDPSCITTVRNGELFDARLASEETQSSCQHKLSSPEIQIYASDVHQQVSSGKAGFTSFTADWVVPALPTSDSGQVVYFWPGFKSKQPEMGLPVLQPVLQFGQDGAASSDDDQHSRRLLGGGGGGHWQLQSWFVDGNQHMKYPVVTAPAIAVSPGDKITSYMQLDGDTWTVSGTDTTTGQNSTLKISKEHAGACDYDFAMLVNENINVNSRCALMPAASEIVFTNVKLDGMAANWTTRANCKSNPSCDCSNNAAVDSATGNVTLSWKNQ